MADHGCLVDFGGHYLATTGENSRRPDMQCIDSGIIKQNVLFLVCGFMLETHCQL